MKKIHILLFLLLTSLLFVSCGQNETKKQDVKEEVKKEVNKGNNLSEELIKKEREEISLDDISKLYAKDDFNPKNKLEEYGVKFIKELKSSDEETLIDNINGGIKKDTLDKIIFEYPKELIRNFNLELSIKDFKTKEGIKNGNVYLNGINLGKFKNGNFNGKFKWLKGLEKFIITIRSEGYGDGFVVLNSINSNGSLLLGNVYLKQVKEKEVTLGTKQKIDFNNTIVELKECSIVNKQGECVKGKIKLKVNHISGDEANNYMVSLNREAITKEGKIVELTSGGMSFIDFIGKDGEIYKLKPGEKIQISYKISQKDIDIMAEKKYGTGKKDGYWWYDKNAGIWVESEAVYTLDTKNKIWTAEISNLY